MLCNILDNLISSKEAAIQHCSEKHLLETALLMDSKKTLIVSMDFNFRNVAYFSIFMFSIIENYCKKNSHFYI